MGVLFLKLNETEHMTHPGCYLEDLSKILHFFFLEERVEIEFFSTTV